METEKNIQTLNVELNTDYGQLYLKWNEPETEQPLTYIAAAEVFTQDGTIKELYRMDADYPFLNALDAAAYVCQEYGFYPEMRFRVDALAGNETIASGVSPSFVPADFFPEKEVLMIGSDIPAEEITGFTWSGTGSAVNDSFLFDISIDDPGHIRAEWYDDDFSQKEMERALQEDEVSRLMEWLSQGKLVRSHVMDPVFVILDGSENKKKVVWKNMSGKDSFYEFQPESDEEMNRWIMSLTEKPSALQYAPFAAVAASAVLGLVLLAKKILIPERK